MIESDINTMTAFDAKPMMCETQCDTHVPFVFCHKPLYILLRGYFTDNKQVRNKAEEGKRQKNADPNKNHSPLELFMIRDVHGKT